MDGEWLNDKIINLLLLLDYNSKGLIFTFALLSSYFIYFFLKIFKKTKNKL